MQEMSSMFEYFTFSAPALAMNHHSPQGSISPTNTEYVGNAAAYSPTLSNNVPSTPSSINELVIKLGSQTLNPPPSSNPSTFPPTPVEEIDGEDASFCHSYLDNEAAFPTYTTPNRDHEMLHPNLFSSFHTPTAEESRPCRSQRQILQDRQCRSTFTRDLQQLLEGMIEKGDQCKLADSSPPPSRGRERGYSASYVRTSSLYKNYPYPSRAEDENSCESDENSTWSASAINSPSTCSTSAFPSSSTSLHSRRSMSESRRSSRHRRVASESNISIDFDARELMASNHDISLRRAGAPVGIVKMGRAARGRGDANVSSRNLTPGWKRNVTKLRRPRRDKLTRRIT